MLEDSVRVTKHKVWLAGARAAVGLVEARCVVLLHEQALKPLGSVVPLSLPRLPCGSLCRPACLRVLVAAWLKAPCPP